MTHHNLDIAKNVVHLIKQGVTGVSLGYAWPTGRNEEEFILTWDDIPLIQRELEELGDLYVEKVLNRDFSMVDVKEFVLPLKIFYISQKKDPDYGIFDYHCTAATSKLSVTTNGQLYPCAPLTGIEGFNMGSLEGGVQGLNQEIRRIFLSRSVDQVEQCRSCWVRHLCCGGCARHAVVNNGSMNLPYDKACEIIRHTFKVAMKIYTELEEKAPKFFKVIERLNRGKYQNWLDPESFN